MRQKWFWKFSYVGKFNLQSDVAILECALFWINISCDSRSLSEARSAWNNHDRAYIRRPISSGRIVRTCGRCLRSSIFYAGCRLAQPLTINRLAVILPGKCQCCALQGVLKSRCYTSTIASWFFNGFDTRVRQTYFPMHHSSYRGRYR